MSITDELRHEVANYPFMDNRDFALFEAIADRIAALFASHLIVDAQKARWNCIGYVQDQLSHIVTLALLYGWEVG